MTKEQFDKLHDFIMALQEASKVVSLQVFDNEKVVEEIKKILGVSVFDWKNLEIKYPNSTCPLTETGNPYEQMKIYYNTKDTSFKLNDYTDISDTSVKFPANSLKEVIDVQEKLFKTHGINKTMITTC